MLAYEITSLNVIYGATVPIKSIAFRKPNWGGNLSPEQGRSRGPIPADERILRITTTRISYTTFSPPEFGAGQALLRGAVPPAPQEEQMRASQLYAFADLDVGLPKSVESKEKTIKLLIKAPPAQPAEPNPLANLPGIQGLLPPNIVVPSGWKPGMPVELPTYLPIVPPLRWKPGDPVPLPPLDALPVLGRVEEQQPRPVPAHGLPKAPEPIQVRHVQLDIDDDSSDYSSDMGSSDDED